MRAARYGNVAPWELDEQPITWQTRLLMAEGAEAEAQHQAQKKHERRNRKR